MILFAKDVKLDHSQGKEKTVCYRRKRTHSFNTQGGGGQLETGENL